MYFLFGDIETGGLNGRVENGQLGMEYYPIFELAFIVTDSELNEVGEPLRIVVHQQPEDIEKSHEWALKTHKESGLISEVHDSPYTLEEAEQLIIAHLESLGFKPYDRKTKEGLVFAGSSIMFDRSYIMCQMPKLHEFLHYRQLDVSAIALAARAFKSELEKTARKAKEYKHEALSDIRETIDELRLYRNELFV
jgi:oligoribonuclease (3'-5' exoribonuclease)